MPFSKKLTALSLCLVLVSLSACALPRGYTQPSRKTIVLPEAVSIPYTVPPVEAIISAPATPYAPPAPVYTPAPAPVVAAVPDDADALWFTAATDLIRRMTGTLGRPTESVSLLSVSSIRDYDPQFEKALRLAMAQNNIAVAPAPGLGPFVLKYSAALASDGRMLLTVALESGGKVADQQSGIYSVTTAAVTSSPTTITPAEGF